jgi:phosphatidylserine/phosphatidylglycerophosphate/cardiolipin synthase-like enzyme
MKLINKNKCLALFVGLFLCLGSAAKAQSESAEILAIYFTPPAGAAHGLIKHLDGAKKSIHVMAYGFTSLDLSDALIRAKRRGVLVELIQDEKSTQSNRDAIAPLIQVGIEVRSDAQHAIAHNKVMIIDDEIVVTGSYNFTVSAEKRNAENFIVIKSEYAVKRYLENWKPHWDHSSLVTELPPSRHKRH